MEGSDTVIKLKSELSIARNEIQNLRKQITALSHVHHKDIQQINKTLEQFQCKNCQQQQAQLLETNSKDIIINKPNYLKEELNETLFKPIGIIRTEFSNKKGVPRQSAVGPKLIGSIEICPTVFNNPKHALDGLEDFSHIWIIYHFHRNESSTKSKVAPPRLNGERVGVFSTRSPHRPCPIGLSLVEIYKIQDSNILFFGTDMVDGTPVLDIKPYIPIYDAPIVKHLPPPPCLSPLPAIIPAPVSPPQINMNENKTLATSIPNLFNSREEPDGEESISATSITQSTMNSTSACSNVNCQSATTMIPPNKLNDGASVRIPDWILSTSTLRVLFNERAESEILELGVDKKNIEDVMSADPRSVYIRTKYGSQIFTFQLGEMAVTCKFDDPNMTVTIVRIRRTENLTINDWQSESLIHNSMAPK